MTNINFWVISFAFELEQQQKGQLSDLHPKLYQKLFRPIKICENMKSSRICYHIAYETTCLKYQPFYYKTFCLENYTRKGEKRTNKGLCLWRKN